VTLTLVESLNLYLGKMRGTFEPHVHEEGEKTTPSEKEALKAADILLKAADFSQKVADLGDKAWEEPVEERQRARRMSLPDKETFYRCMRRIKGERPEVEDPGTFCAFIHWYGPGLKG